MQCPKCEYICFRKTKVCGSCGFNFKKANTSNTNLFREDSFTIFADSPAPAQVQESAIIVEDSIAVMTPPEENTRESLEPSKSDDFALNLEDAEQTPAIVESSSEPDPMEFAPLEFGSNVDINLEEIEVEGLGLGLEPLEEESAKPEHTEENTLNLDEPLEALDLAPEKETDSIEVLDLAPEEETRSPETSDEPEVLDLDVDGDEEETGSIEVLDLTPEEETRPPETSDEPEVLDLDFDGDDSLLEIILDDEPEIEPVALAEEKVPDIKIDDTNEISLDIEGLSEGLDLTPPLEIEQEIVQAETELPVLDLGDEEVALKIDDEPVLKKTDEPTPAPAVLDELDLKLEIDDSEGPLATLNIDSPDLEIEDLGLELEEPEDPSPTPDP